ncbi:MAG: hypothetical protein R6X21_06045 [Candidatus Aminicenantes bacterium]
MKILVILNSLSGKGPSREGESREVQVQTRRRHITVSADGQLMTLQTPLNYRIRPKALRVFAPETAMP